MKKELARPSTGRGTTTRAEQKGRETDSGAGIGNRVRALSEVRPEDEIRIYQRNLFL
jgi:hypothetical protein